ncbi:sulfotransferase [Micromonospora marina]|uniref:sulfotransferase n=1 Tax=Micromonospora marina TaxID=307120 RepID=UPI003D70C120
MPYALFGCPRSGTNLLSSLLKHTEDSTLLVEPFSMYLPWVLPDDLFRLPGNERSLRCRCGGCYLCELREGVRSGRIAFKETSLFEYLDVLAEEFDLRRVVYLERERERVVDSYAKHELWSRWRLTERKLSAHLSADVHDADVPSRSRAYSEVATDLKRFFWRTHAPSFEVLTVDFDDLVARPREIVREIFAFLGQRPLPTIDALIERKFRDGGGPHVYATHHYPL